MSSPGTIVWFRLDLRVADNPALSAAADAGGPVIPVFIWAPHEEGEWSPGPASIWWLRESLCSLDRDLRLLQSRLVIRRGGSVETLLDLCRETGARRVFWNRRYEPAVSQRDAEVEKRLSAVGVGVTTFNGSLLTEPGRVLTRSGKAFKVFSAFWRACLPLLDVTPPLPAPSKLEEPRFWPSSLSVEQLELQERGRDFGHLGKFWSPGSKGAGTRLAEFLTSALGTYEINRDRLDLPGTSRLSPHLHFGELSPGQLLYAVRECGRTHGPSGQAWARSKFVTELGWREFAAHLLWHFPESHWIPLRQEFRAFPWRSDERLFELWRNGQTGYPIVDAAMRELRETGWMHNRARMIVASFLVKHLLISWNSGAKWFWERLVDADLANNTLGWQWTSGCGVDAAPFFRIFNPVNQGRRFDPDGNYVRKWVPELRRMNSRWVHCPWEAPDGELESSGVKLGRDYPFPIVEHRLAREVALAAHLRMRRGYKAGFSKPRS
ncbi:MAG: DNA photolyase family protein [Verrucomicrobiae bacterium]|nr:DNA photolyase family protein [Verrucomicrobiae bacterium]